MAKRTADEAAATREALVDAGLAVFAERGYSGTQIEEVARRAGVTRGAFYHHFRDKAALYLATLGERWPRVMRTIGAPLQAPGPLPARLKAFMVAFLSALETDPELGALLAMSLSGDAALPELAAGAGEKSSALAGWANEVAAAFGKGQASKQRAVAVIGYLNGLALTHHLVPGLFSPRRQAEHLADLLLNGLAP